jgi:hypothetical protein
MADVTLRFTVPIEREESVAQAVQGFANESEITERLGRLWCGTRFADHTTSPVGVL